MLAKLLLILAHVALNANADNLLARSEGRRLANTAEEDKLFEELTKEEGGCFSREDEDNQDCLALTTEGDCWLNSDCRWKSSCEERKFNLFEFPKDENFCWLIRDAKATKDDAKKKGACSTQACKDQCGQSYRRSPRGKKARLCYWDPSKAKCRGGNHYVVDEERCAFLPPAPKTPTKHCEEKTYARGPFKWIENIESEADCMLKVMELGAPSKWSVKHSHCENSLYYNDCIWSDQGYKLPTHLGYFWSVFEYRQRTYKYCYAMGVLEDPEMHENLLRKFESLYASYKTYKTCWLNVPISA